MRWDEASGENVDIEFHDSVVVALSTEGKTLAIRLSPAWVHRSAGKPGVDAGTVWTQEATLRLDEAVDVGERSEWPAWLVEGSILNPVEVESDGYIYDGRVEVDGRFLDNCVPARCDLSGKVVLMLHFGSSCLSIAANRLRIELIGEPEFIDVFPSR